MNGFSKSYAMNRNVFIPVNIQRHNIDCSHQDCFCVRLFQNKKKVKNNLTLNLWMSLKGEAMTSLPSANPIIQQLNQSNESSWLQLGLLWESLQDVEKAHFCFENTLRHNPYNIKALTQAATICRLKEYYPKVIM